MNASVTPQFVERHKDKPWAWGRYGLSTNASVTPQFVELYKDKPWDWGRYGLAKIMFKVAEKRKKEENNAATVIQRGCHDWLYKPLLKDGSHGINARLSLKELNLTTINF
jgi:hypothetical protein